MNTLYRWTEGSYRPVPPPTTCAGCGKPAEGLLSWNDHMGRLEDFAGCEACAKTKRQELKGRGIVVRAGRLTTSRTTEEKGEG